ncbi:MAG: hypothetical protein RL632_2037 [Bacteroidota bacterium]|jgi:uncharacterized membrane protein
MEKKNTHAFGFRKENYKFLIIGLAINILGYLLMIGGAAKDPNSFDESELFSEVRITVAPILIVAGFVVILYSIMKKPTSKGTEIEQSSSSVDKSSK